MSSFIIAKATSIATTKCSKNMVTLSFRNHIRLLNCFYHVVSGNNFGKDKASIQVKSSSANTVFMDAFIGRASLEADNLCHFKRRFVLL